MLIGTSPEVVERFAGRPPHPEPVGPADLPAEDRSVWTALGQGGPAWICPSGLPPEAEGWSRVYLVEEAPGSQFDALRGLLGRGFAPPGPVAALALTGKGFHGHRGRGWAAVEGNLHLCALFAPPSMPARDGVRLVMLPAVAVVDALRASEIGLDPRIKWVNDILVEGRKTAGVLSVTQSKGDRLESALLGIGLNVERTPDVPPTPFLAGATSIRAEAGESAPGLPGTTWLLLGALMRRYGQVVSDGPGVLFPDYRRDSMAIGRDVRVFEEGLDESAAPGSWPEPIARGLLEDIEPDLTLRIAGHPEPVGRGRLALEDACRAYGI